MQTDSQSASPTSVPLPVSPQSSPSEFDALIELFATDEPGDPNLGSSHPLTDKHGQLDFARIRSFFDSSGSGRRIPAPSRMGDTSPGIAGTTRSFNESEIERAGPDSTHEPAAYEKWAAQTATSAVSSLALSPASHRTIESSAFIDGLSHAVAESTPLLQPRSLQGEGIPGGSAKTNRSAASGPPSGETNSPQDVQRNPPALKSSLWVLNQALGLAHQEVADLKVRCRELEDLVGVINKNTSTGGGSSTSQSPLGLPPPSGRSGRPIPPEANSGTAVLGLEARESTDGVLNGDTLSSSQIRAAFKILLDEVSSQASIARDTERQTAANPPSLDDIRRALDMVIFLDELVWKRSRFGAPHDNPYSEDSVEALREHLELWEKAVRTRR